MPLAPLDALGVAVRVGEEKWEWGVCSSEDNGLNDSIIVRDVVVQGRWTHKAYKSGTVGSVGAHLPSEQLGVSDSLRRVVRNMLSRALSKGVKQLSACDAQLVCMGGLRTYHKNVVDHYENPRNVGSFKKDNPNVGTGLVGAPACGDVMQFQIKVGNLGLGQVLCAT